MNPCPLKKGIRSAVWWIAGISLLYTCSMDPVSEGGGSRGGNPVIVGTIVHSGNKTPGTIHVALIPEGYNPMHDSAQSVTTTTADTLGSFSLVAPDSGWYSIEARANASGERLIHFNIEAVFDSTRTLPSDTLRTPGTVKIVLPENVDVNNSFVYVPGTTIAQSITKPGDTLVVDSVPQGVLPVLYLGKINSTTTMVLKRNIPVQSNEITIVRYSGWNAKRHITLNTSPTGAAVTGDVYGFPVLIRLTQDNFDFSLAQNRGEDIRFSTSEGKPLDYEIETWDALNQTAVIWVNVDTIYGMNATQYIIMYWENPSAHDASNGAAVFDTASGYQAVWHFNDANNTSLDDATANDFTGFSPDTATPLPGTGITGPCRVFDGVNDGYSIPNTADGILNFQEDGYFTISTWVSIDTLDGTPHVIVAKGYDQYSLRSSGATTTIPVWGFAQLGSDDVWETCSTFAVNRQWTLLTAVREGTRHLLYRNGTIIDSTPDIFASGTFSRNTSSDVSIGRYLEEINVPNSDSGYCYFNGSIDEIQILNRAVSPDWVRLCYMNQYNNDLLVKYD